MLIIRLSGDSERQLADYVKLNKIPKSQVVSEALEVYFAGKRDHADPFVVGEDLFGVAGSNTVDGFVTYKTLIKAKISEKHAT